MGTRKTTTSSAHKSSALAPTRAVPRMTASESAPMAAGGAARWSSQGDRVLTAAALVDERHEDMLDDGHVSHTEGPGTLMNTISWSCARGSASPLQPVHSHLESSPAIERGGARLPTSRILTVAPTDSSTLLRVCTTNRSTHRPYEATVRSSPPTVVHYSDSNTYHDVTRSACVVGARMATGGGVVTAADMGRGRAWAWWPSASGRGWRSPPLMDPISH